MPAEAPLDTARLCDSTYIDEQYHLLEATNYGGGVNRRAYASASDISVTAGSCWGSQLNDALGPSTVTDEARNFQPNSNVSFVIDRLLGELSTISALCPISNVEKQLCLIKGAHSNLVQARELNTQEANGSDANDESPRTAVVPHWGAAAGDKGAASLPLNARLGIRLFFRLLRSVQSSVRKNGKSRSLSKLVHQLPALLAEMPPLALSVAQSEARSGSKPSPQSPSLGVVDALSAAMESVVFLRPGGHPDAGNNEHEIHDPADFHAAMGAYVGLAVKRGSLPHILRAIKLLLLGPCPDDGGGLVALYVGPYLQELAQAVPEVAKPPNGGQEGRCGKLMTFGKGDHGKLGHGMCTHTVCADGNCTENKLVPTLVQALSDTVIVKIDSLSTHSVAVNAAGELFSWGNGDKNRSDRDTDKDTRNDTILTFITCLQAGTWVDPEGAHTTSN
jgi:hypothetical protein